MRKFRENKLVLLYLNHTSQILLNIFFHFVSETLTPVNLVLKQVAFLFYRSYIYPMFFVFLYKNKTSKQKPRQDKSQHQKI